jgi:hypothetical protein
MPTIREESAAGAFHFGGMSVMRPLDVERRCRTHWFSREQRTAFLSTRGTEERSKRASGIVNKAAWLNRGASTGAFANPQLCLPD